MNLKSDFNQTWIIFVSKNKFIFYDYTNDFKKEVILTDLKIKVLEILDNKLIVIGFSDGSIKIYDVVEQNFCKTLRGYHKKDINHIIPYTHDVKDKPRLIVSSKDGLLAC